MPADANIHGDVFGSWITSAGGYRQLDPCRPARHGRVNATVAVNAFQFKQPVFVRATCTKFLYTSITLRHDLGPTVSVRSVC